MSKTRFIYRDSANLIISGNRLLANENGIVHTYHISEEEKSSFMQNRPVKALKRYLIKTPAQQYCGTELEKNELYYYMHRINPQSIQHLQRATVMIIGLGGIGTEVFRHLVSSGVSNFVLVDFDKVNITNLNRQYLYSKKDLGKSKVLLIKRQYPNLNIITENKKIVTHDDFQYIFDKHEHIDIVINCADTPPIRIEESILSVIADSKTAFIGGGVGLDTGSFGPLLCTKKTKKQELQTLQTVLDNVDYIKPCISSFGPTNSIISAFMAKDAVFFLLGNTSKIQSLNRRVVFDFNKLGVVNV